MDGFGTIWVLEDIAGKNESSWYQVKNACIEKRCSLGICTLFFLVKCFYYGRRHSKMVPHCWRFTAAELTHLPARQAASYIVPIVTPN